MPIVGCAPYDSRLDSINVSDEVMKARRLIILI